MTQSFASIGLAKTVTLLLAGERDTQAPALQRYYNVDFSVQRGLNERYAEVLAFRTTNDLPFVSAGAFSLDTSVSGGPTFFEKVVNGSGIETTLEDDLVTQDRPFTSNPRLSSFILKESRKVELDRADLINRLGSGKETATKHLQFGDSAVVSDEDNIVFLRLKQTHDYIRDLIR